MSRPQTTTPRAASATRRATMGGSCIASGSRVRLALLSPMHPVRTVKGSAATTARHVADQSSSRDAPVRERHLARLSYAGFLPHKADVACCAGMLMTGARLRTCEGDDVGWSPLLLLSQLHHPHPRRAAAAARCRAAQHSRRTDDELVNLEVRPQAPRELRTVVTPRRCDCSSGGYEAADLSLVTVLLGLCARVGAP